MTAFLIALTARLGVAERYRKLVGWVMALVALIMLLGAAYGAWRHWLGHHTRTAIELHDARRDATIAGAQLNAQSSAGANMTARDQAFANQQDQLREKAHAADDTGGDALDALFNGMRATP